MANKCCYNKVIMKFNGGREDEDKRRQEYGQPFNFFFQSCPFWA